MAPVPCEAPCRPALSLTAGCGRGTSPPGGASGSRHASASSAPLVTASMLSFSHSRHAEARRAAAVSCRAALRLCGRGWTPVHTADWLAMLQRPCCHVPPNQQTGGQGQEHLALKRGYGPSRPSLASGVDASPPFRPTYACTRVRSCSRCLGGGLAPCRSCSWWRGGGRPRL
jgi:hypothetical protein